MASVTHQALLLEGRNPLASSAGWHWPLGIVADAPLWRDTSGFNGYGAWLAAIPYAASNVPKSVTWQLSTSLPNYLLTRNRRLLASLTDDSLSDGSWIYNVPANPATPRALAWQQPLSALLHSNAISRLQAPAITDPSSYSYAWLQAAGVSSAASAFLARTSGLNATHVNAYIALINGLVTDGVWTKFDALYILATQDSTTAKLNLISSSYNGVVHGSPSFSVDLGYTGVDGSGADYIATGFVPSSASSPHFVRDSAHISVWNLTNTQTQRFPIGTANSGTSKTAIHTQFTDGNTYFYINGPNSTTGVATAPATAAGHYIANRSGASAWQGYKNGSSITTGANASQIVSTTEIVGLAYNGPAGIPDLGEAHQIAMMSFGESLSGTDATNFYTRLRTYMTAVGVP